MSDFADYIKRLRAGDMQVNPFLAYMAMTLEELREGYARFRMRSVRNTCKGPDSSREALWWPWPMRPLPTP